MRRKRLLFCLAFVHTLSVAAMALAQVPAPATPPSKVLVDESLPETRNRKPRLLSAVFSPDGTRLAMTGGWQIPREPGELILWDVASGTETILRRQNAPIRSAAFTRDGKRLAMGDFDGNTLLIDAATGQTEVAFDQCGRPVYAVAFADNDQVLIAGSFDGAIRLWDIASKTVRHTFSLPDEPIVAVAVSPDGRRLAATTWEGQLYIWDLASKDLLYKRDAGGNPAADVHIAEAIAFSPDGKLLVTGSWDSTLRLWEFETGSLLHELKDNPAAIHAVAFSPDGKTLAAGDGKGFVHFWDTATGEWASSFMAHTLIRCFGVAFSRDGTKLVTASWDRTAKLWDVESRTLSRMIRGEPPPSPARRPVTPPMPAELVDEYTFSIVNVKGQPVVGADVTPSGAGNGIGSAMLLDEHLFPRMKSDEKGQIVVRFPTQGDSPAFRKLLEFRKTGIKRLGFFVEHVEHPNFYEFAPIDKFRITLPESTTIEIRARRENDPALLSNLFAITDGFDYGFWPDWSQADGVLTLRRVDRNSQQMSHQMRVVHFPPEGPVLFSNVIDLNEREDNPLQLELTLKPGVRVEGRLADNVPRPVMNGRVIAIVSNGTELRTRMRLRAVASINADGTFVIPSLPAGETAQIVAGCDGWASTPPPVAEGLAFIASQGSKSLYFAEFIDLRVYPQLHRLEGTAIHPVLNMRRTATCAVTVKDVEGKPISGAEVSVLCQATFFDGTAEVLGGGIDDLEKYRKQRETGERPTVTRVFRPKSQYLVTTDANGVAVIKNLAPGSNWRDFYISVYHEGFDSANPEETNGRASKTIVIRPGSKGRITVHMKKKAGAIP